MKTIKSLLVVITLMLVVFITGCTDSKLKLSAEGNVTEIAKGESVQLVVNDKSEVTYEVTEGRGTVNASGLLTCDEEAEVGSKITVKASNSEKSATLTLTVVDAVATSIEVSADSTEIKKGQKVVLSVVFNPTHAKVEGVTYVVTQGSEFAEIIEGKVQIKEEAVESEIIGSKIVVTATTTDTNLSDTVELTVVEATVQEIILSSDVTSLSYGKVANLTVSYIPAFVQGGASYTLSVIEGSEYVELVDGKLSIKEGLTEEQIVGKVVKVKATLDSNTEIYDELSINLVEAEQIIIVVTNKTFIAGENATEALLPEAYDSSYNLMDLNATDFTYISSNEDIVKVGEHDGKLTATGHGHAEVTVIYRNSSTVCDIYVIVVPENIEFTNLSAHTLTSRKYYYSMNETLEFDLEITNNEAYNVVDNKVTYKFELLNKEGEVVKTGDAVATVEDGKITFKEQGDVRVTVTTDSSLNGKNTASHEKSTSLVVSVNDGFNIRTVADILAYQEPNNSGKAANFINTIKLTETENFGLNSSLNYAVVQFEGDRYMNGNGYAIDLMDLPLVDSERDGTDIFRFIVEGATNLYTVEIRDLEFIGNYDLNRQYIGNVEADKGKDAIKGSYNRALRIGSNMGYDFGVCKDLVISNVKISGFNIGLRIEHSVNAYVTDINISQCFSNGIELNQNIITLNNIYVGQVGAFAIEMVPDDMIKEANGTLHGSAGYNFDQAPETKLTGTIESYNFNNGRSTVYMSNLLIGTYTITEVITMLVGGKIQYVAQQAAAATGMTVEQCQAYLADLAYRCLYKDANPSQSLMNFFLLVFVDPTDAKFAGYNDGNKTNAFGTYTSDEADGNMISVDQILIDAVTTLISGGSYDAYKNYKYVLLDLDLTSAGLYNLGEVVLVNEAYAK